MPFLRVIRDKRGYETTYLMHWYREGTRQRSRILYIFRSPGGVRVGREALDPDVLRDLETHHPDIAFDWKAVLDNRQVVDTAPPDLRRPRKRRRGEDERAPAAVDAPSPPPAARPRREPPSQSRVAARPDEPALAGRSAFADRPGAAGPAEAAPPRPSIPSVIEGATPDEQIAFLAQWYPKVRDRIAQRTSDPARREALLALAERLNSGTWTDADQIVAGLQQAAESLERLSRVFARRRRRPKRPAGRPLPSPLATMSAVEAPGVSEGEQAPTPTSGDGERSGTAVTDTSPADE